MKLAPRTDKKPKLGNLMVLIEGKVELPKLGDITLSEGSPWVYSQEDIVRAAAAITEFGFWMPLLVNKRGVILAGELMYLAAQYLDAPHVPVLASRHLTDIQEEALIIAHSQLNRRGGLDEEKLKAKIQYLVEVGFNVDTLGFDHGKIEFLLETSLGKMPDAADVVPEIGPGPAITKPGYVWLLGGHRLICGNSLDPAVLMSLMRQERAVLIFTDPPFNVRIQGHVSGLGKIKHREFAMASGEMTEEEFIRFLSQAMALLCLYSTNGSIHFICMDWRHMSELLEAAREHYSEYKQLIVWNKDNGGMGGFYRSKHELIAAFKNGAAKHINNFGLGETGRYRTNVWDYAGANTMRAGRQQDLEMHPTVKPVALVADALKDCSNRGDIVLDVFMGSGTTLIAAERTGRLCRGIELDPLYVDVAVRRWQALTGQQATLEGTGQTFDELAAASLEVTHD